MGTLLGAIKGALIGQETESGFIRGASVGAISGAVFSVEVFESSLLLWQSDESGLGCLLYLGAGKSAVLNSLIGHPVLPTGEGGATRAPICVDLSRDGSLSNKSIILQIDSKSQSVNASSLRHSLQERLSKISGKSRDEINLKLRTSTAPPLKLIDLPRVDKGHLDDSLVLQSCSTGIFCCTEVTIQLHI